MDPFTETIDLLKPAALLWKQMEARGPWAITFPANPAVVFCLVSAGDCVLRMPGAQAWPLRTGDFVLLSAPDAWTLGDSAGTAPRPMAALAKSPQAALETLAAGLVARIGEPDAPLAARVIGGHFSFAQADAFLLHRLLPRQLTIAAGAPGSDRFRRLLELLGDEATSERPGGFLVVRRLLEIILVEALRHGAAAPQAMDEGLLVGMAEPRIAAALRAMHGAIERPWTVADLAAVAGMSRSGFAEQFSRRLGCPPMDYLLNWRMALARQALREGKARLSEVADRCGYGSASAFSAAFLRVEGCTPSRYAAGFRPAA